MSNFCNCVFVSLAVVIPSVLGTVNLAMAQANEWSDIAYIEGKYSRIYLDFTVAGATGTFYCINDWMTNQDDGQVSGGLLSNEYNRFNLTMGGDAYEIRIYADGHGDVFKNGSPAVLPGFLSKCSWSTSPNEPSVLHTIWEFSFEVPGTTTTVSKFIGSDPKGPTVVVYPVPPDPPVGLQTGPSSYPHYIDGFFSDALTPPTAPPVPARAYQNPERDVHFDPYDDGEGWEIDLKLGGGVVVHANKRTIPTVSEWGLIILTQLLLIAGTIIFARRRPAVTAA